MAAAMLAPRWVRLAQPAAARVDLRRPAALVSFAAFMVLVGWWFPQYPDPYSSRWAGKAAIIAFTALPLAAGFLGMAAARLLVGFRAVAAMYGRTTEQGVEIAGFAGRFGWKLSRRHLDPGEVFLEVPAGGARAMPMHLIVLSQGKTKLMVSSDAPWEEGTVPGLIAWLDKHGIEVVEQRPPAWPTQRDAGAGA